MSIAFVSDLQASQDILCPITIHTLTGDEFLTGVKDVTPGGRPVPGEPPA
jgi:hypothetical protein